MSIGLAYLKARRKRTEKRNKKVKKRKYKSGYSQSVLPKVRKELTLGGAKIPKAKKVRIKRNIFKSKGFW